MDTGTRPGSLGTLKWIDIRKNTAKPKAEIKIWIKIDVPAEKTKTGRSGVLIAKSIMLTDCFVDFPLAVHTSWENN